MQALSKLASSTLTGMFIWRALTVGFDFHRINKGLAARQNRPQVDGDTLRVYKIPDRPHRARYRLVDRKLITLAGHGVARNDCSNSDSG